ncbi:MAG: branched-chain amino acid ABC transporter permease [Hyphomicrobiaceae bacterium]|nr:branched-chain amino acid ABC transporter permease [Hyphomicrobiaceae bacterium]
MKLLSAISAALLLGALPFFTSSNYVIGVAISACIFTTAAAALNLVYGYTGLLSFAQLGFWGIGGYATALTVMRFAGSFWLGLVWAALIDVAIALAIGYPAVRTNRHAFVIVTLAFALLVTLVARDWVSFTRGPLGIPGLPAPNLFGFEFRTAPLFYWIAYGYALLALGLLYALCTSRIGRTLVAIKQNESLVRAHGISPVPYKLAAFAVGAAITGVGGGIFAFHLKIIDPLFLDFYYMQTFLIIVIIGGAGSYWGVIAAGVIMSTLPEILRFSADFRMIVYGVVLLLAVLAMPGGVGGWLHERRLARARAGLI